MNSVTVVPCGRKGLLTGLCRAAAALLLALTALSASPEAALAQANEGDVRLNSRGRLFLYENGAWGTVCNDNLRGTPGAERVAQVVCRQLGRTGGTFLPHTELPTFFGSENVRFYNVNCTGTESRLADCSYTYSTRVPCDHGEDVGVRCNDELLPPPPGSPTGLPTITGTARVGQTLTVDTSGISDPDGPEVLEFAYQWLARGVAIATATAKTYTVTTDEVGKRLAVQVSFTDGANNVETLRSAATDEVPVPENTAAVMIGFRQASPMPTAVEGGSGSLVDVDVSPAPNGLLFIPITATGGGGAEAGDFTISPETLTFNSGETAKQVTVTAVDDEVDDDGETVTLGFGTLPLNVSTVGALQATFTVGLTDNDERGVRVSKESMTVPEGGSGTYTVVLASEPTAAVMVTMTTDLADTGLEVEPARLTFTARSWSVARTVTVSAPRDDNAVVEPAVTLAHAAAGGDYEEAEVAGVVVAVTERPNAAPTGRPGITGRYRVGDTLTAIIGDIGDPDGVDRTTFAYQWLANDASISNATSKSYTLAAAQLGQRIKVRVTFTDGGGAQETLTSLATSAVVAAETANQEPTGLPTISGTVRLGQTLTANTEGIADADGLTGARYLYQWLANDTAVFGETGLQYTVQQSDVGKQIKVRVSFTDERGNVEVLTSAATATVPAQANDGDVRLSSEGRLFMYQNGAWGTVCDDGLGETSGKRVAQVVCRQLGRTGGTRLPFYSLSTYDGLDVLFNNVVCAGTENRLGDCTFRYSTNIPCDHSEDVAISCTDETAQVPSFVLEAVVLSLLTPRVDEVVTADVRWYSESDDNVTNIDYQWFADREAVTGATAATYTPAVSDQGKRIHVEIDVTFTNNAVSHHASPPSEPVLPGLPTIMGTAQVGRTLTADTSRMKALVFTYQWLAGGEAISTATAKTYTVMTRDVGKRVAVQVSFTDEDGNEETLTSASTAEVAAGENTAAVTVGFRPVSPMPTAVEGGSGALVAVDVSPAPNGSLSIPITATGGGGAEAGDFTISPETLTFNSGETSKNVTVTAVEDAVDDDGETVTLGFGTLPSSASTVETPQATLTVGLTDNDERGVRVSKESMTVTEGGSGSYTVVVASEPTASVTVTVTTDPADTGVRVEPASLTFTGTSWSVAQTVTVSAAEDDNAVVEPVVTLAHAAAGGDYEGAEVAGVAVTVTENDTPTLAIGDARGGEDAGVLEFVVSLSVASSKTVTVNYATADGTATAGSDYTGASGVLTFAPGVTDSQTIEVQITDDAADDEVEAETFTVTLSGAANATLQDATGTGTIDDDDDPAVTVAFGAASYRAAEGGSGATVVLSLSADPERTVEIPLTAAAGGDAAAGDYEVSAQAVTFAPGETAKQVTVTAVDDAVDDEGESVTLGFGALPPGVTAGSVTAAVVALEDNDERGVRVSKESMTVPEGGRGSYTVVLGSEPTAAVTVTMTTGLGDTGLEAVAPASLTFTGTSWSVAQTVTVSAAEDDNAVVEPVVTLAHAAAGGDYEGAEVAGVAVTVTENDTPTLAIADARGGEDAGVLEFVVSLSVASSKTVTVNYATADGTATAGSDYTGASGVLTFAPGVTDSQTIEVQITDDAADDEVEAETFTVGLSGAANATLQDATGRGTIEDDDDPAVTVAFGAASYTAAEGGSGATVVLSLSADPERTVEIALTAVAGGNAAAGDYGVSAQAVTFAPGETAKQVTVTAVDDAVDDDGESVTLGFGAFPAGVTAGSVTAAVVALEDNDERGVRVSKESMTVPEGGSGSYTVVLGSEPTATVTVTVTTGLGDTGLEAVEPASLTFTGTSWSVAQTVTVSAAEDDNAVVEPVVTLAHAAAGGDYEGAEVAVVSVTVLENDTATLAIGDARGGEAAGVLEFVVSMSTASSKTVTVSYATADGTATAGSDYTGASGVLTFAAGVTESQTIEVQITDDAADDEVEAETFMVTLSGATNAELAVATGTGTIDDDDDPAVTVAFGAASYRAAEGGDDAVVAVTLSADPERTVEIALTAAGGGGAAAGDYTLSATSLTFESGATAREVRVTAVEDAVDDDGESVTLGFDASGLPAGVTVGSLTAAVVELEDNDEREVRVLPASLTVTEGGAAENYTVVLGSEPTAAVTVSVTTDLADTGVRVEPASLTFTAANWSTAQTVAVSAAEDEDALAEPVVRLEHVASGGDYTGVAVSGVAVTVLENDVPTLAVADATGGEGAGVLHFVVSLSVASSEAVTVGYATVDGTAVAGADYEGVSGRLTFTAGAAGSRTIEVRITDDAEAEDAETFTVELSGETNAVLRQASATGTIEDDDAQNRPPAALGVIEEKDLTVGGEAVAVDVSGVFADPEGDELTYEAESSDTGVATVAVAGTEVTVAAVAAGRALVTVTATDGAGSDTGVSQSFVVVVSLEVGGVEITPAADGGTVVEYAEAGGVAVRMEVAAGTGRSSRLDTDGDGDVDEEDELPVVRGLSGSEVPEAPQGLRVDTGSAVDIAVPEQLTANGATVRVCLATSLDSERLALYRYDAEAQEWQHLESAVEPRGEQRFVCAEVGDFSVFAVFEERATDVSGADVNGNGRLDGDDALVMHYAYTLSSLLGDGETGGVARFRRALLAGRAGSSDPSDAELMAMLLRANAWRGAGADADGDVNEDGEIDGDDALVMYYAYTLGSLLGDGQTGGVARFRQTLLAGRAGSSDSSDSELTAMLRRANDLRERLR